MCADKGGGRAGHHRLVQAFGVKIRPVYKKGVADPGVIDLIGVLLFQAGADGVKPLRHLARGDHYDVLRQPGVKGQRHPLAGDGGDRAEVGDIDPRVHPRVRPPGTGKADRMSHHLAHRLLQCLLDGGGILLYLPAVVGGADVHQLQGDIARRALPSGAHSPNPSASTDTATSRPPPMAKVTASIRA